MYKFVNRDEGSSVYSAVTEVLVNRSQWTQINPKSERFNLILAERNRPAYARLGTSQAINYYRGSSKLLCRKVSFVRTVRSLCGANGSSPCQWMPESFIIVPSSFVKNTEDNPNKHKPRSSLQDERESFIEAYNANNNNTRNIWIGKSNAGAKGENIFISDNAEEMLASIDSEKQAYIVQRYIENPLLLDGQRKFDVRVWVLLDHMYKIHVFSQGVLRTSSEPYDVTNLSNMTSHLTNHCIQEAHSDNFGKYEKGNEMFFEEFSRFLLQRDGISFKEVILPQIHTIVHDCLMGIQEEITTVDLSYDSFQLFGFDFMVDQQYKVWLLEVNGAPAAASDLLASLSQQLVSTAIDTIFPPSNADHMAISQDHHLVQSQEEHKLTGEFVQIN